MKHFCSLALAAALLSAALPASGKVGADYDKMNRRAVKEYSRPVRPGNEGRNPYWNTYSHKFTYAPVLEFPECEGASAYLCTVYLEGQNWEYQPSTKVGTGLSAVRPAFIPDDHISWSFKSGSPEISFAGIWNELPEGYLVLKVEALDRKGDVISLVGTRRFLKDFRFSAPAQPADRSYGDAARMALRAFHNHPAVKHWRDHDTPMMEYDFNSYAAKIIGSTVRLEALVMKMFPRLRDDAESAARNAASYLKSISFGEGNALAYFPPTYIGTFAASSDPENDNTAMVMESLYAANAYLELFDATKDSTFLRDALNIADGFRKIQNPDGSFPVKVYISSGKPVREDGAMLGGLLAFLRRLEDQFGIPDYDEMKTRGEKWMYDNPAVTLDFSGQFEDVTVSGWNPYESLTNCTAAVYASYILGGEDVTKENAQLAKDIIDLCEDQFVVWDCFRDRQGAEIIHTPCVLEQYPYRRPVDDSACNMANAFLDYYNVTGDRLSLEKALALMNSITRVQDSETGMIPTLWYDFEHTYNQIWINCLGQSILTLLRFSELFDGQPAGREYDHSVFLAGDSTCSDYSTYRESARPRCGWGEMFQDFMADNIRVVNYARSGRSSKSFIAEGSWRKIIDEVKPEDYVLIQFGHNDGHVGDTARYAEPFSDFKDYQRRFVNEVREKGAVPVLVTNTTKATYDGDTFVGGNLSYAQAIREVAGEMDVPLLEVEKRMMSWMSGLKKEEAEEYFCFWKKSWVNSFEDRSDRTHLNYVGAAKVAGIVADAIRESDVEPLRSWLKDDDSGEFRDYDVYLAIGQSNMAGRGYMKDADAHVVDGVWLLDDEGKPVRARNPFNQYSSIRKELMMQQVSPSYSFSKEMHDMTGRRVLMVVNARGGSSIDEWEKGTEYYDEIVRRAREAMEYGQLKGIIWHQGCTDVQKGKSPYAYAGQLRKLISDLRDDLGAGEVPFVAGGLPTWHIDGTKFFNEVLMNTMQGVPCGGFVSANGLYPRKENDGHLSRQSQINFGKRYAEKMNELIQE